MYIERTPQYVYHVTPTEPLYEFFWFSFLFTGGIFHSHYFLERVRVELADVRIDGILKIVVWCVSHNEVVIGGQGLQWSVCEAVTDHSVTTQTR